MSMSPQSSTLLKKNDALIAHKITLELAEVLKERVETLREYFHLATLRYEDGLTDYLTYLDAERQLFSAELDYAQAQGDSFVTLIDIYKSLGGGWVLEADKYAEDPDANGSDNCLESDELLEK